MLALLTKIGKLPGEPLSHRPIRLQENIKNLLERNVHMQQAPLNCKGSRRQYGFGARRLTVDEGVRWQGDIKKYCTIIALDVRFSNFDFLGGACSVSDRPAYFYQSQTDSSA